MNWDRNIAVLGVLLTCASAFAGAPGAALPQLKGKLTPAKIYRFIQDNDISTVEELLPRLPVDFRSRPVLMHTSGSRQGATFTHPRVILFRNDGDSGYDYQSEFVLTFNGDALQRGFQRVEMMHFTPEKEFEFFEIDFTPGRKPLMSEANPQSCRNCHGERPRPIWAAYASWPGAYGAEDDSINLGTAQTPPSLEGKRFSEFLQRYPEDPRYQHLRDLSVDPNRKPTSNVNLSLMLHRLNRHRIMKDLSRPEYIPFRPLLLAAFSEGECGELSLMVPTHLKPLFLKSQSELEAEVLAAQTRTTRHLKSLIRPITGGEGANELFYYTRMVGGLKYVLDQATSLDMTEWSLQVEGADPSYFFSDGLQGISRMHETMLAEWKLRAKCDTQASLDALSSVAAVPKITRSRSPLQMEIQNCLRCHSATADVGPYIPFDRPDLLVTALQRKIVGGFSGTGDGGHADPAPTLLQEILFRLSSSAPADLQMPKDEADDPHRRGLIADYIRQLGEK